MRFSPRGWLRLAVLAAVLATAVGCASPVRLPSADGIRSAFSTRVAQGTSETSPVGPDRTSASRAKATAATSATRANGVSSNAPFVPAPVPPGLEKIKHFVLIMQENRSFDSYFGTYPGADGIPDDVCLPDAYGGPCIAPYHDTSAVNRGGPHNWDNAAADVNGGAMDGFVLQAYNGVGKKSATPCVAPKPPCKPGLDPRDVMGYHDYHEIPNYWNYAHLYVLQDHMFSPVLSYTLPNRLYSLAGQSGGWISHSQGRPTRFDFPSIVDELSANRVSWTGYVTSGKQPDTLDGHVVGIGSNLDQDADTFSYFNPFPAFPRVQNDPAQRARLVDTRQFYADAKAGRLAAVSWVIPNDAMSEHPPSSTRAGMAYVTGLVNAVMEGPDWDSTAIFISYDEWGGFYDHVAPPRIDGYGYGIRVPGLVISPYAKEGYVDHHQYSTEAWLRIVEERFGLPPLTARDAQVGDMLDAFDFTQRPRAPIILSATLQGSPYPHALQAIEHD